MIVEGRVGPNLGADGANNELRLGKLGGLATMDAHGRYYEAAYRSNIFFAANQAGIATPAGLTTASKNFTLYNPLGSGKNLAILDVVIQAQTNAASGGLYLVANTSLTQAAPATVTSETIQAGILGGAAGVAKVYNTCTLPSTPVIIRPLPGLVFTTSGMVLAYARDEIAGGIIIQPGVMVSIQGSAAFTCVCGMTWEENNA